MKRSPVHVRAWRSFFLPARYQRTQINVAIWFPGHVQHIRLKVPILLPLDRGDPVGDHVGRPHLGPRLGRRAQAPACQRPRKQASKLTLSRAQAVGKDLINGKSHLPWRNAHETVQALSMFGARLLWHMKLVPHPFPPSLHLP